MSASSPSLSGSQTDGSAGSRRGGAGLSSSATTSALRVWTLLPPDTAALAAWHSGGARGSRPEPRAPVLRAKLEERRADATALSLAANEAVSAKIQFVSRRRKGLTKRADQAVTRQREKYLRLVDELEQVRGDLLASRAASLYVRLYPKEEAVNEPPQMLCLGHAAPLAETIGVASLLSADRVWELLRRDAALAAEAISDSQRAALGFEKRKPGALWHGSPEALEAERQEKAAARERYRQEWGVMPREFG